MIRVGCGWQHHHYLIDVVMTARRLPADLRAKGVGQD
jgi:hypothetical protein